MHTAMVRVRQVRCRKAASQSALTSVAAGTLGCPCPQKARTGFALSFLLGFASRGGGFATRTPKRGGPEVRVTGDKVHKYQGDVCS